MSFNRTRLLLIVLIVGCGGVSKTPPVASLADSPASNSNESLGVDSSNSSKLLPNTGEPPRYVVRKAVAPASGPAIPPVLLSAGHAKLCNVQVGDSFPSITLPKLGGGPTELASLRGSQATVVLFWHPDRWMARTALIDTQRDIAAQFAAQQVAVVGIAVRQPQGAVQAALNQAKAEFPQLIDTEGKAFAAVGTQTLPRIYVLDPGGKVVWFDIEYSEGTRRELWQTLSGIAKQ